MSIQERVRQLPTPTDDTSQEFEAYKNRMGYDAAKMKSRNFKPDAAGLFYYGAAKICCKKILGNAYHIRMGKIYNLSDLYNHCPDCTSDKF